MKKVQLGKTDITLTPIAFGAWAIGGWMWGGADRKDALKAIETGIDVGISTIDTAPIYGFGLSEELVGEAIKGKRDKVEILTKYGMSWDTNKGEFFFESEHNDGRTLRIHKYASKENVIKECEASLKRLGTDYIDLYQLHWPDATTPVSETMEAIDRLLQQGKIRAAGVSNYNVELSQQAFDSVPLASNQVPYSMVNRAIEADLVPWCLEHEVSILAYSPLQRGLLTGKIKPDHRYNPGDTRDGNPYFRLQNVIKVNDFLDSLKDIAEAHKISIGQLVIAWTIRQPGISVALVGARNRQQVEQNAGALHIDLTNDEIVEINNRLANLELTLS